ncbi:MAG: Mn2+/Fe2+ NRAMP family transporter [Saprospiraceae bacterium]|jgi:Mn2+/Fe2+ NRAMP family transporter
MKKLLNILGPGLLFASSAIGTSHLVLSTRAGAHHGMTFIWVIILALLLKYPFYQFAPRYAVATGQSLIQGYKKQGNWALGVFFFIIIIEMLLVTGAIGAVSAGLISALLDTTFSSSLIFGILMIGTTLLLMIGKYRALEKVIKVISVLLVITMTIIFVAVLLNGPIQPSPDFTPDSLWEGAGLALMVGLLGWMPNGMEASTMHSIWILENGKADNKKTSLKNALLDFNIGYGMTLVLALMFLIIGAYVNYGSGNKLDGGTVPFMNKLLALFTDILGEWSFTVIAIAAFGTIYGTLITVWDAMARCFTRCFLTFKSQELYEDSDRNALEKGYLIMIPIIGIGGALLFSFFTSQVIAMLELATIIAFILSPVIAFLNWKAITSVDVAAEYRPSQLLHGIAFVGLVSMIGFALYYGYTTFSTY